MWRVGLLAFAISLVAVPADAQLQCHNRSELVSHLALCGVTNASSFVRAKFDSADAGAVVMPHRARQSTRIRNGGKRTTELKVERTKTVQPGTSVYSRGC